MVSYEEARVKLTNAQLIKLKPAAKNKTGTTLWITKKNCQGQGWSYDLSLTTRQTTKIRKTIAKNMLADIKLNWSKIIQSVGCLRNFLDNFGKN